MQPLICSKVVGHLLTFKQGLADRIISKTFFEQSTCVVNGKRTSLNATAMTGKKNLVAFTILLFSHWLNDYPLISLSSLVVFLYFLLKHLSEVYFSQNYRKNTVCQTFNSEIFCVPSLLYMNYA